MDVFFNDEVTKIDGKNIVTRSYFTEERIKHLSYVDNVKTKVIQGLEIPDDDLDDTGAWMKNKASEYHAPLLKAFLDKYAK